MKAGTINLLASAGGLVVLVTMVSVASAIASEGRDFRGVTFFCNCLAVAYALAAWSGSVWGDAAHREQAPKRWQDWMRIFGAASLLGVLFVAIDVAIVHPGISLMWTIGAVTMAFVALPSALRAWMLETLSRRYGESEQ